MRVSKKLPKNNSEHKKRGSITLESLEYVHQYYRLI